MTATTMTGETLTSAALKTMAIEVAGELQSAGGNDPAQTGGGSRQRGLPEALRERFIRLRTALFQRGIFDPVLVRFDTASAPQASTKQVGEQLAAVAAAL
jgi:hypothetical protein